MLLKPSVHEALWFTILSCFKPNRLLVSSYNSSVGRTIQEWYSHSVIFPIRWVIRKQLLLQGWRYMIYQGGTVFALWRNVTLWFQILGSNPHYRCFSYSISSCQETFPLPISIPDQQVPVQDLPLTPDVLEWHRRPYLSGPSSRWPPKISRDFSI